MAAFKSGILWLHFLILGGGGDTLSIFTHNTIKYNKTMKRAYRALYNTHRCLQSQCISFYLHFSFLLVLLSSSPSPSFCSVSLSSSLPKPILKKTVAPRPSSSRSTDEDIQGSKDALMQDLEKKLRSKEARRRTSQVCFSSVCVCVFVCVCARVLVYVCVCLCVLQSVFAHIPFLYHLHLTQFVSVWT